MQLNVGIEIRQEILQYSLLIENFTSIFLAKLLGIDDYKATKSFGNQSGNMSFNQKVELLIDIGALDRAEKKKFQTFMEVRNQFMHNYDAQNYVSCFSFLEGKSNFVLKLYPQSAELSLEERLHKATIQLAGDVITTTVNLVEKVKEKIGETVKLDMLEKFQKDSFKSIKEIEDVFNKMYASKKEAGETNINLEELKDLGKTIRQAFIGLMITKIKNNTISKKEPGHE